MFKKILAKEKRTLEKFRFLLEFKYFVNASKAISVEKILAPVETENLKNHETKKCYLKESFFWHIDFDWKIEGHTSKVKASFE